MFHQRQNDESVNLASFVNAPISFMTTAVFDEDRWCRPEVHFMTIVGPYVREAETTEGLKIV